MRPKVDFSNQFRQIQPKFSRFYSLLLTELDLTLPQFALLSEIASRGPISMTEASRKLHLTKPAITHLVDQLEKKGRLKRAAHSKDRRVYLLEIHPKGKKIVREIQGEVLKLLLKTLGQFRPKEKETIQRFYLSLSENLDQVLIKPASKET